MKTNNENENGQSMVLIALFIVMLVAFLGLVFDVGNAYAQRRFVQNGADASSIAGSRALANRAGNAASDERAIWQTILTYTGNNGQSDPNMVTAYFIDSHGNTFGTNLPGNGLIPQSNGNYPSGVQVTVNKNFTTIFLQVINAQNGSVSATAAAWYGPPSGGGPSVMPMARKCLTSISADDQCGLQIGTSYNIWQANGSSGNFGWLAWNANLENATDTASMLVYGNTLSSTAYVDPQGRCTALAVGCRVYGGSGVSNSSSIQSNLDQWITNAQNGEPVIVPIYDDSGGTGSNAWYHIVAFAAFELQSYNLSPQNGYIYGKFVNWFTEAPVCPSCKTTGLYGFQLSR